MDDLIIISNLNDFIFCPASIYFHKLYGSMDDNKKYKIECPEENLEMKNKFEQLIKEMRTFNLEDFHQNNIEKCKNCIYEDACDRALIRRG